MSLSLNIHNESSNGNKRLRQTEAYPLVPHALPYFSPELTAIVFNYLGGLTSAKQLVQFRLVCKKWKEIIDNSKLIFRMHLVSHNQILTLANRQTEASLRWQFRIKGKDSFTALLANQKAMTLIWSVNLNGESLEDISPEFLKDKPTPRIVDLTNTKGTINSEYFSKAAYLNLSGTRVSDASKFSSVRVLRLRGCQYISDVSALSRVRFLDISNCSWIRDVSMLGKLHTLILASCQRISDVSALGALKVLDITGCQKITDVSALSSVKNLIMKACQGVTDVSDLSGVEKLNLDTCLNVKDVSTLGNVPNLTLSYCEGITSIKGLTAVTNLEMSYTKIKDISPLAHNTKLAMIGLEFCTNLKYVGALANVRSVNLGECWRVEDVSALGRVETLILTNCKSVRDVSALGRVRYLDISYTPVSDVSALTGVHCLSIAGCTKITDITPLRSCYALNLSECTQVTDISDFSSLHTLVLKGCSSITINPEETFTRIHQLTLVDGRKINRCKPRNP